MSDFTTAARRLADSVERLVHAFFISDAENFQLALPEIRRDLPIVVGSLEPLGLEHADLLRQRIAFILKRAEEAFDKTQTISECVKKGVYFAYHRLTRNQIETDLRTKAEEVIASLLAWVSKADTENSGLGKVATAKALRKLSSRKRGPKGPRKYTNVNEDQRIYDGWKKSGEIRLDDYIRKYLPGKKKKPVQDALERERKRRKRAEKRSD